MGESNEVNTNRDQAEETETGNQSNSNRFSKITDRDVGSFLSNQDGQLNNNTTKKTNQDMSVFKMFLAEQGETRAPEVIPPLELNKFLSSFLLSVKKKDGGEYEPTSLRCFNSSIDRYLKMKAYPVSILKDVQFKKSQEVLKLKQKQLKSLGEGKKPRAADCVTDEQIELFYKTKVLGSNNQSSLLHSMWTVCTVNFGMRVGRETHDLQWGDIALKIDESNSCEYLEYTQERQIMTRPGMKPRYIRKVKPRAYALRNDPDKDPVSLYKLFAAKRPDGFNTPDSPFFLTANNTVNIGDPTTKWYTKTPLGINKMYKMMQGMKEMSGIKTDQNGSASHKK